MSLPGVGLRGGSHSEITLLVVLAAEAAGSDGWFGRGKRGDEMGRRSVEHKCAQCGKRINGTATECIGCLRLFHSSCLQRVKLKNKRPSYMLCPECIEEKPMQRVMVGPPKIDLESGLAPSTSIPSTTSGSTGKN